jgi:hypothetical protein
LSDGASDSLITLTRRGFKESSSRYLAAIKSELLKSHADLERREVIAMTELTLESLAKRVEALEIALSVQVPIRPRKDWRKVIGMFGDIDPNVAGHPGRI